MGDVELEIPARPQFLSLARQAVAAIAAVEPTFRDDRIDDLRIAVSEAITNAVVAHAGDGTSARIRIRCHLDVDGDSITVEVLDRAGGFDPASVPVLPDAQDPGRLEHEHGLGIPIMRQLSDEAAIERSADGTSVRLVVYRSTGAADRRGTAASG